MKKDVWKNSKIMKIQVEICPKSCIKLFSVITSESFRYIPVRFVMTLNYELCRLITSAITLKYTSCRLHSPLISLS